MKTKMIIAAALCAIGFVANAQTKGTSTIGLGASITSNNQESNYFNGAEIDKNNYSNKNKSFSLGYGFFFKDNQKLSLDLTFVKQNSRQNEVTQQHKVYGGNLNYQRYFPLIKTFYAFAGGTGGYSFGKGDNKWNDQINKSRSNNYNIGAMGGFAWFINKRFALETTVLSANANYQDYKEDTNNLVYLNSNNSSNKSFNLKTGGLFNELGFKVFFVF